MINITRTVHRVSRKSSFPNAMADRRRKFPDIFLLFHVMSTEIYIHIWA